MTADGDTLAGVEQKTQSVPVVTLMRELRNAREDLQRNRESYESAARTWAEKQPLIEGVIAELEDAITALGEDPWTEEDA